MLPTKTILTAFLTVALAGCAGSSAFKKGKDLERTKNFDEALQSYSEALQKEPTNREYRLYYERARFQAATAHFDAARRLKEAGNLEGALAEFQRASEIDPSNGLAAQEVKAGKKAIEEREKQQEAEKNKLGEILEKNKVANNKEGLSPIQTTPITLKLSGNLKRAYDSIAKVGGINVIYDPDLGQKATTDISIDLNNVTVVEALDILALQSKTYWTAVNKNTILVANENQQTRQLYEEQVIKTFYLGNSLATQDLTEAVNMLRMVLTLQKVAAINSQNAIVIRDTPDKVAMAEKILQSIDKAKSEVLIDVTVLEVDRSLTRNLGVSPPTSTSIPFNSNPGGTASSSIPLNKLSTITGANFSLTIPTTTITALTSQIHGRLLQNPTLRAADGKVAKLRIGKKQPVAQGSFQPTFAGNIGGTPVVNFTYIDVGVNLDMTPHVLLNRDVAMNIIVEVNDIAGFENFGSGDNLIRQPVLTQRHIEHDVRLKEGESSILGGIIADSDTVTITGLPGLSKIPLMRYLFSSESKIKNETEIIVVITPHILRLPEYAADDFSTIALLGSGNSPRLIGKPVQLTGDNPPVGKSAKPPTTSPSGGQTSVQPPVPMAETAPAAVSETAPSAPRLSYIRLSPSNPEVAVGTRISVSAFVENAQNAFAISMSLSFNPKILRFVEAQNGGFLNNDGKSVALVPRPDNDTGQVVVSLTRPPESQGVSGKGSVVNLVFEAVGTGVTQLNFTQANLRDPGQATLPTSFTGTQVTVK